MTFRVTDAMLYRTSLANLARNRGRLAATQEQATTGLRINRPSDDPVGVRSATLLKAALDATEQYQRNINQARTRTTAVESQLTSINESLVRMRELVIQGASETLGPQQIALLAEEVEDIHDQLVDTGNARVNDAYIFSGYASQTQPFSVVGNFTQNPTGSPTVAFGGDTNEIQTAIDEGVTVGVTLNGQRVFMGDADGDSVVDTGREDLFQLAADIRDALVDGNTPALQTALLGRIDTAILQVSRERTAIGAADAQILRQEDVLTERSIQLSENLSDAQDADAAEVFSNLVRQEAALEATLDATARVLQPSLLNFIS